ncbi:MAG: Flp pilus assembly complex ATPase component TadA, partial [Halobacteriovoraceae bacterium]|nr:Flp pilus assembly complex ATPase component TadA [Halobacteriovoraceae bacterium]
MIDFNPIEEAKSLFKKNLQKGKILSLKELDLKIEEDDELNLSRNLLKKWYLTINSMSFLPPLLNIEEIFIHSPSHIVIKNAVNESPLDTDLTKDDLLMICEILAQKNNLHWNYTTPFASFYSEIQGVKVRVSMIHYSATPNSQSKIFIRILNNTIIPLESYNTNNKLFKKIIQEKKNILIAGATASGKTTFTNTLINQISPDEHIIIIEDTQELMSNGSTSTRLLCDPNNQNKSMNHYLSYSLRMSPERIILGEIRGKEAESSLLAMNTGHNGFISTIHANSAHESLHRLALLFKIYSSKDLPFEVVLKLITSNIDYVVFLENKKI